jgi:hypothetical protein
VNLARPAGTDGVTALYDGAGKFAAFDNGLQ